ncbi:hypothetical protein GGI04_003028 [Coemansia thaxteri]|uniref:Uncharacterized protein n=1 Tax=Coemansia thaxteri TaxID=2663907 RepID=A0A9W8BE37_9FUNG|nr:hypothetical protein GGI04_003028 [Coemansia thaxteri]KAJ2003805.1 hypothetical protein H4R26_002867 [Coemansia thaxteri]KAJ2473256.1 hypothetical protein GGI02_000984 [Coemansia sp. RSA 2322]KAJ2484711.1 hypothetical protein EV174_002218 [Coemansia sp. RSA 2320]
MLSAARRIPAVRNINAAHSRYLHQRSVVGASGFLGKLFGGGKKKDVSEPLDSTPLASGDIISDDSRASYERLAEDMDTETLQPKFPKRQYSPARLAIRVKEVLQTCEVSEDGANWELTSLEDKDVKLKVLSGVMKYAKLPVSSRMLNNIRTVGDLLAELNQGALSKDAGHPVSQFYTKHSQELPANMKFEPFVKGTRKLHAHQ